MSFHKRRPLNFGEPSKQSLKSGVRLVPFQNELQICGCMSGQRPPKVFVAGAIVSWWMVKVGPDPRIGQQMRLTAGCGFLFWGGVNASCARFIKGLHFYPAKLHFCEKTILQFGPKVGILFGRCLKKSEKHAARTPVGQGGKEGGSEKSLGGVKVVQKVGIPCGRCREKSKTTCSDNAGSGGRECEMGPQGGGVTCRY